MKTFKKLFSSLLIIIVLFYTYSFAESTKTLSPTPGVTVSSTYVDYTLQKSIEANEVSGDISELSVFSSSGRLLDNNGTSLADAVNYYVSDNPYNDFEDELEIYSPACILIDEDANEILYEKNAYQKMYPASTTKVMTAILTVEKCNLDDMVNVSYYAVHEVGEQYSSAHLVSGESLSVRDLLMTLLIESANDSAYALAQFIANGCTNNYPIDSSDTAKVYFEDSIKTFSEIMNTRAKELGAINTHFVNPNGIHSVEHYSCAYDLAVIGKHANSIDTLKEIVKMPSYTLPSTNKYTGEARKGLATNKLLQSSSAGYYQYATGFKTGNTTAGKQCIIATAEKENRHLICVVLHNDGNNSDGTSREHDCKKLFEYGFNEYTYTTFVSKGDIVQTLNIYNATDETKSLNALANDDLKILIKMKHATTLTINPEISIYKHIAPIHEGDVIGKVTYTVNGGTYETDLIADHDVEVKNYLIYVGIIFGVFLIALVIVIKIEKKK